MHKRVVLTVFILSGFQKTNLIEQNFLIGTLKSTNKFVHLKTRLSKMYSLKPPLLAWKNQQRQKENRQEWLNEFCDKRSTIPLYHVWLHCFSIVAKNFVWWEALRERHSSFFSLLLKFVKKFHFPFLFQNKTKKPKTNFG